MTAAAARTEAAQPEGPAQLPAVVCACLLMLAALVDSQVVGAIAPQVAAGVGASKAAVAASVTAYSIAAACVALLLARGALRGRPAAAWLPVAALMFVAGAAVAAAAPHVAVFWAGRAVAGLAGGLVSALVVAALADASSYARRGRQMSGVAVCYFLAPVVGVPVAAWLAGRAGWRAVFVAVAVATALAGLLVRLFPLAAVRRDGDTQRGDGANNAGDEAARAAGPDEGAKVSLWRLMMRTRTTRRGVVSAFFVSGGLVGLTTYLGAWLSDSFNATAADVGATYAVAGAGAVVGGFAGGALADRWGSGGSPP